MYVYIIPNIVSKQFYTELLLRPTRYVICIFLPVRAYSEVNLSEVETYKGKNIGFLKCED